MDELQTYSAEEVEPLIVMNEELQTENEQLRTENQQLRNSLQEQSNSYNRLLTQLCKQSESEMPSELQKKLQENEKKLLTEQKTEQKLREKLNKQDTAVRACEERISELEAELKSKDEYVSSLDRREKNVSSRERAVLERERAVSRKEAFLDEDIRKKAYKIEQDTIAGYEAKKAQCETDKKRIISKYEKLIADETNKIQAEADRQAKKRIEELEIEYAAKQEQLETGYIEKHQQLDKDIEEHTKQNEQERKNIAVRNAAMVADNRRIGAGVFIFGLICGIVGIYSTVVAFLHGLLPTLSADARQLTAWISEGYTVIKIGIPILFVIGAIVWALFDFNERRWVFFIAPDESKPDKLSLIILLISVSISAFGGKWLTEAGINTVAVPLIAYTVYFLLRSNWVIFVIVSILKLFGKAVKGIAEGISDYFREAEPHQIMGNLIIVLAIVVPLLLFGKCNGE